MPTVTVARLQRSICIPAGATLLSAANRAGVPIGQSCSGDGICGWCRLTIVRRLENIAPPSPLERRLQQQKLFEANERAASLAVVCGDVVVSATYW